MGFPVGYTDLFFPKLLVHVLTFLGLMRKLVHLLLSLVGLGEFLEPEMPLQSRDDSGVCELRSISAILIRELLPVVKFSDLSEAPESCAVCLYEFDDDDEIRRLTNCRHIFHRNCLDRWMDHDQKTCPLCRTPFVPREREEEFNQRLWAASPSYSSAAAHDDYFYNDYYDENNLRSTISAL